MVANLFDFHYINYIFRSTEDLNCAVFLFFLYFLHISVFSIRRWNATETK
jgi:hypothetical protein